MTYDFERGRYEFEHNLRRGERDKETLGYYIRKIDNSVDRLGPDTLLHDSAKYYQTTNKIKRQISQAYKKAITPEEKRMVRIREKALSTFINDDTVRAILARG